MSLCERTVLRTPQLGLVPGDRLHLHQAGPRLVLERQQDAVAELRALAGSDVVAAEIAGAVLGTTNLAEVVGKLVDSEVDVSRLRQLLGAAGVTLEPLSAADAELAGAMRSPRWPVPLVGRSLLTCADGTDHPCRGAHRRSRLDRAGSADPGAADPVGGTRCPRSGSGGLAAAQPRESALGCRGTMGVRLLTGTGLVAPPKFSEDPLNGNREVVRVL